MSVGDRVTVVHAYEIDTAFVTNVTVIGFTCERHNRARSLLFRLFYEECVTWCKGVVGPAVDALRAGEALR